MIKHTNVDLKGKITYKIVIIVLIIVFALIVSPAGKTVHTMATRAISKTEKKLPIYCVDNKEMKIAISFDAAWGADDTDELLSILKENDVKTTFFMCGYWVEKYPDKVKLIYEAGHDLGNHSSTHPH
ncbi:MAG: polysaccharide deacetylase family protein, partial [Firmicutes bacterium]|nr:polysaccharide deacetylase family protein [Bacillota bacterium]